MHTISITRGRWVAVLVGMLLLGAIVTVAVQWRLTSRREIVRNPEKPAHRAQVRDGSPVVHLRSPPSRKATAEHPAGPVLLRLKHPADEVILWDGLDPPCRRRFLMRQRTWEDACEFPGEARRPAR